MRNDHGSFRGLHRGLFYGNRGGDSGLGGNKGGGDNMDGGRSLDVIVDGGKSGVFACGGGGESSFESSLGFGYFSCVIKVGSRDLDASEDGCSGLKAGVRSSIKSDFKSSFGGYNFGNIVEVGRSSRSSIKGCLERSFSFGYFSCVVKVGGGNLDASEDRCYYLKGGIRGSVKSNFESSLGSYHLGNIFKVGGISRSSIKGCLERSLSFGYFRCVVKVCGGNLDSSEDGCSYLKAGVGGSVESDFEKSLGFFHLRDIFEVCSLRGEGSVAAGLVEFDGGQVSGCGFSDLGGQLDGDGGGAGQQAGNYQFHVGESGPKNLQRELCPL